MQKGVDAQLVDKISVRLSGQFVSPRLSNRLSHLKPAPPPRGAPWIALALRLRLADGALAEKVWARTLCDKYLQEYSTNISNV